jgi:hypothetical protein
LKSWRQECSQEFMDTVAGWSNAPDVQTRVFALQALAAAVGEGSFENLPAAFGMVRGVADRAVKGERQALDQLVRTLARRSAPETTRFLMDELERGGGGAERMCRTALPHLPPRHRARLNNILSG